MGRLEINRVRHLYGVMVVIDIWTMDLGNAPEIEFSRAFR